MLDPPPDSAADPSCGDCAVAAALDIALYWDLRGYGRLVDDGNLGAARRDLRRATSYDCGTSVANTSSGLRDFITAAAYANQYPFAVTLYANPAFTTLRAEIDAGQPALLALLGYANDPDNPSDCGYGDHGVCAVGYFTGSLYPGHSGTEWVIIHDNWGGGDYANPNAIDNEPYLDWKGNIDYLIRVVPQPQGTPSPTRAHPASPGPRAPRS
jgi:hypothetical protein